MRLSRRTRAAGVALLAAGSLVLAACGGGGDDAGSTDQVITNFSTEPENPLIPQSTNETGGGRAIDLLFAGLVSYQKDGSSVNEVAESIESEDNKTWTVKLKDWTFSDGSPVTASSFVDAWNYGALSTNAQKAAYFYYPIKGFDAVSAEKPTAKTLEGLKVVDDKTFTIELNQPEADFPARLGYSAFFPLPESAFDDIKAYGEDPIGNGPYKLDGKGAWEHDVQIKLVPNEEYDGVRKPKNGGITLKFFTNPDTAYTAVQTGDLDVLDAVPPSALPTFQDDDQVQAISEPGSVFGSITIPERLPGFGTNDEGRLRRQAISKAINREEITKNIFDDTRTPAVDFSAPVMPGFDKDIPGSEVLQFDAAEAKDLWAQADDIAPFEGSFTIAYNGDGAGNKEWVDAVVNQLKNNLGIDAKAQAYATFDELRSEVTNRTIKTAFRTGWQPDYPSIFNYLAPLYQTKAGSNDGDYSNKQFDDLMTQVAGEPDEQKRYELQSQAQEILFQDLPAIPLWYSNVAAVASKNVENVEFNWQNQPELHLITKK
jgi:oligopeptide transport system substrate-binding protein